MTIAVKPCDICGNVISNKRAHCPVCGAKRVWFSDGSKIKMEYHSVRDNGLVSHLELIRAIKHDWRFNFITAR